MHLNGIYSAACAWISGSSKYINGRVTEIYAKKYLMRVKVIFTILNILLKIYIYS